jgi:hypothetical protein
MYTTALTRRRCLRRPKFVLDALEGAVASEVDVFSRIWSHVEVEWSTAMGSTDRGARMGTVRML